MAKEDWQSIGCEICHRMENDTTAAEVTWFNTVTGYHETVSTPTTLCEKCHRDADPYLHHKRDLGDRAHTGFVCTDCHDPHTTIASCSADGCHAGVIAESLLPAENHVNLNDREECLVCHPAGMKSHSMEVNQNGVNDCLSCHADYRNLSAADTASLQHSSIHSNVACVACHDAAGLEVGPVEGQAVWVTFRSIKAPTGLTTAPYQSHNLQRAVDCRRCHYPGNEWGITESVDQAQP